MTNRLIHDTANSIVDRLTVSQVRDVATLGYKAELPGLTADEDFELRNAIQDLCKCIAAGGMRHGYNELSSEDESGEYGGAFAGRGPVDG